MVSVEDHLIFMRTRMSVCFLPFLLFWLCSFPSLAVGVLRARGFGIYSVWPPFKIVAVTFVRSNQVEMKSCCGFCVLKSIYLCMWRRDIFSALFLRVSAIMFFVLPFWYDDLFWFAHLSLPPGISMLLF